MLYKLKSINIYIELGIRYKAFEKSSLVNYRSANNSIK